MRKVSRLQARLCIILSVLALIILIAYPMVKDPLIKQYILSAGLLSLGFALCIKYFFLRCNHCGRAGLVPHWNTNEKYRCPRCGNAPEYDR